MVGAAISANPLKLDVWSHKKCLGICAVVTIATFQYGLGYAMVGVAGVSNPLGFSVVVTCMGLIGV